MAKAYIDIVKYMVEAKFEITGLVEKPDIIGAVFGQTEGLLGGGLDLRELQKNGKIGRIEINTSTSGSRTLGKLYLPSSLGRVETCILAAAIESVDRVGPFETGFKIEKIEDTRNEKRNRIINRAKELVKSMLNTEIPDSKEISELVEADVKSSVIGTYGPEALPAGPDIAKSEEIVIVEGRADVINLLKNDIPSCIAVGGATGVIPKTIIDLCNTKDSTIFVDGDRGGEMIVKNVINVAEVDYVARAPDGKEVEELTRKEIIKALRSKVPLEQYMQQNRIHRNGSVEQNRQQGRRDFDDRRYPRDDRGRSDRFGRQEGRQENRPQERQQQEQQQDSTVLSPSRIISNLHRPFSEQQREQREQQEPRETRESHSNVLQQLSGLEEVEESSPGIESIPSMEGRNFPNDTYVRSLDELRNTLRGRLYGEDGAVMKEVPIRELIQSIQDSRGVRAIVFDGIITQRLIELAYRQGVREIYGIRSSQITKTYNDLGIYTTENGKI